MTGFLSTSIDRKRLLRITVILAAYLATGFWFYVKVLEVKPFVPTTQAQRVEAIGDLAGLSATERGLYGATDLFQPMGAPKPLDWLARFPEPGQSFRQYQSSGCLRPDDKRRTIYFQPVWCGVQEAIPDIEDTRAFCSLYFGMDVVVKEPIRLDTSAIASRSFETGRQWNATDILKQLKAVVPPDAFCVLALTTEDLYPDETYNFVFGLASIFDRVGIFSVTRLNPAFGDGREDKALRLLRTCKVLVHETGHMFGCYHCIHFRCLMNGSNSLPEADRTPIHLCPVCLRKLQFNIGFDLIKRYQALAAWLAEHGYLRDAEFIKAVVERALVASSGGWGEKSGPVSEGLTK